MLILRIVNKWFEQRLMGLKYSLINDSIIYGRLRRPIDTVRVLDIKAWIIYPEMGFDVVELQLIDGTQKRWFDKYNDLIGCLRQSLPDREVQTEKLGY
jgi:hypothetical protein